MTLEEKQRLFVEGLKFVGTAVTATVAVYSCLTDGMKTIRRDGHLLNKGRWLIALALGGAALSGTIQIFEYVDALDNASQMSRRFESLIRAADEISEPVDLNGMELDATLTWSASDNHFAVWRKRISEYYAGALNNAPQTDPSELSYTDGDNHAQLFLPTGTLKLGAGSPLLPSAQNLAEQFTSDTLNAVGLVVTVCRAKPKEALESEPISQSDFAHSQLIYAVGGSLSKASIGGTAALFYRPGEGDNAKAWLDLEGVRLSDPSLPRLPQSRFFKGVTDFIGARIEAELPLAKLPPLSADGNTLLRLALGRGISVLTTKDSTESYVDGHGKPIVAGCLARNWNDTFDKSANCRQHCDVLSKQFIPPAEPSSK